MKNPIKTTIHFSAVILVISKLTLLTAIFLYPSITISYPPEMVELDLNSQEIIKLTNDYRQKNGLAPLSVNVRLTQAAVNKANDLLIGQYFDHNSPDGKIFSEWIREVEYNYFYVGENLAIDFKDNKKLFQAWTESPTHQKNLLRPQYQEIGVAAIPGVFNDRYTVVVVQMFGTRVLGVSESSNDITSSSGTVAGDYLLPENSWQKFTSLSQLQAMSRWNNYLLIIFVGLSVISYAPQIRTDQINIKQPITRRYTTKTFKE